MFIDKETELKQHVSTTNGIVRDLLKQVYSQSMTPDQAYEEYCASVVLTMIEWLKHEYPAEFSRRVEQIKVL